MSQPHDPDRTVDESPSAPPDSLDAGLAAGFAAPAPAPRSSLDASQRPLLLGQADGESDLVVRPNSDAMPDRADAGDRYQLYGEIARGGMGAVLRGRDADLGRDLAVKVLLPRHAGRPEVARRFLEEAQIGGQLQHPGVVPVYDVGRFGDRPFFTMKLVKGKTLAALLAERAAPSAELPRFLGDFLKVAQAVAYAHAKGVIHRDLKPANVMVGAFGEVQVMDWGLAKVLQEGGAADEENATRKHQPGDGTQIRTARSGTAGGHGTDTEAGSLLGTPAYMPPEQANGDVTLIGRRADVFGLGAILCEVLTGRPPYVGRSSEEVRRKAANGDLADAAARLDACGADDELVALTKACLSPEPIDRPKDAQAVAEALTAYLDGVQERLHQAELAEAEARAKAVEEARRRRLTLALAATVLLAVMLGGGGWLFVKNERDARRQQVASDVNDAMNRAAGLRAQARATGAADAALLLAKAREQAQRALALAESGPADADLLAQVERLRTELAEEEGDRALVAALDAARLDQAKTLSQSRFALELAVPKFREAFAAYGLPAGQGDAQAAARRIRERPAAVREAVVAALAEWVDLVSNPDEWVDLPGNPRAKLDEQHLEWLATVLEASEPEGSWGRKVLAAGRTRDKAARRAALEALAKKADVSGLPARALTSLARRLRLAPAAELLRKAALHHPGDFWVNQELGFVLQQLTPPERTEAVRYLTAAVALRPDSPGAWLNLGNALQNNGQLDEAIACYDRAIQLDPKYPAAHGSLGNALQGKGWLEDAIACYERAIELDPKFAATHSNLGVALADVGELDDAIAHFERAIELDPQLAEAHVGLGITLREKGRTDDAITSWRKAVEIAPKNADVHYNLGIALRSKGRLDDAISSYKRAVELDPKLAEAHFGLGIALYDKGWLDDAIASFKRAVQIDPRFARAHYNLGAALYGKGRLDDAIASLQRAVELQPRHAAAHRILGAALHAKGRLDDAIASYERAVQIDPTSAEAHYNLGIALYDKGQVDKAIASYQKVIALDPKHAQAHCNLGAALGNRGRFAAALAAYQRGHELGSKQSGWRYPSAAWVRQAERMAVLEARLPAVLEGRLPPRDVGERLGLIAVCQAKKLHHAATRLYSGAFAADPRLADDLRAAHRYNAGCGAARAADGQGEDAAELGGPERLALRRQALTWLRADLALWARLFAEGEVGRSRLAGILAHWQKDADLASLRDKAALQKLSAEERAACQRLWSDVAALLKRAK